MRIPDFVFTNGGTKNDWIPKHDKYSGGCPEIFSDSIKEIWWRNNWAIRTGLKAIQIDVELNILKDIKISASDTSISNLSRKTRLNRETIKHPERYYWVRGSLDEIEYLYKKKITSIVERSSKDKSLISNLRKMLNGQREETTRIYVENQELKVKLDVQRRINENYFRELERIKKSGKTVNFSPNLSTEKEGQ
jgi:hypothetical protein